MSNRTVVVVLFIYAVAGCAAATGHEGFGPTGPADGLGTLESPYVLESMNEDDQDAFYAYLDTRTHAAVTCRTASGQELSITFPGKSGTCAGNNRISYLDGAAYWSCLPRSLTNTDELFDFQHGIFNWQCGSSRLAGPIGINLTHQLWSTLVIGVPAGFLMWAACDHDPRIESSPPAQTCTPFPAGWTGLNSSNKAHWARESSDKARWCGELVARTELGFAQEWGNRATACSVLEDDCLAAAAAASGGTIAETNTCR